MYFDSNGFLIHSNVSTLFHLIHLISRNSMLVTGTYWLHTMYLDPNGPHLCYYVILTFATHSQLTTLVIIVALHAAWCMFRQLGYLRDSFGGSSVRFERFPCARYKGRQMKESGHTIGGSVSAPRRPLRNATFGSL